MIEPNERLFNQFHYECGDDPTVIAVRCPAGLPRACVNAIVPLGLEERKMLWELKRNLEKRNS